MVNRNILKFKELLEDMSERTIPGLLKSFSEILLNDLKDKSFPYSKSYNHDVFDINLSIIPSNRYYSNIDVFKVITKTGPIDIKVEIKPDYDIYYIIATIIHEIRHIYDIYTVNFDSDMQSFIRCRGLSKLKNNNYRWFINMIYLSLEHELIARNNMIYPFIKFRNVDIDEAKKIVKTSFINKSFVLLEEFDYNMFINSIDKDELVKLTNIFNKEVLNQTDIITDVVEFYKKWEDFFKQTSIEWRKEIDNEIDRLYEFIDTNEFILHSYHQNMIGFAQKVLIEVYKNKIKKWKII
jgi:hypothetical protein